MAVEETEAKDPVVITSKAGTVEVGYKLFYSEKLAAYDGKEVLVTWDETDSGEQVWVGDLDGNLIDCANWMSLSDYAKTQASISGVDA